MKKFVLVILSCVIHVASFAQLPDLLGQKASVKQLQMTFGSYKVEDGRLLKVGSANNGDNIYTDATVSGRQLDYEFVVTSDNNGTITTIMYLYDDISEAHFQLLKNKLIKSYKAQLNKNENGMTVYTVTKSGVKRKLIFIRNPEGKAVVSFKIY